jgi:hypothetical protein
MIIGQFQQSWPGLPGKLDWPDDGSQIKDALAHGYLCPLKLPQYLGHHNPGKPRIFELMVALSVTSYLPLS